MDIKKCIDSVVLFNEIAGNLNNITHASLVSQAKVVFEEGNELFNAVIDNDPNEILKECVDCLVVIHGFAKMLEEQGYDVTSAWSEVNANNLSKFPSSAEVAIESQSNYYKEGIPTIVDVNDEYSVFVIKNFDGKVVKPMGYKKCSVAAYTPKGILPVAKVAPIGEDI